MRRRTIKGIDDNSSKFCYESCAVSVEYFRNGCSDDEKLSRLAFSIGSLFSFSMKGNEPAVIQVNRGAILRISRVACEPAVVQVTQDLFISSNENENFVFFGKLSNGQALGPLGIEVSGPRVVKIKSGLDLPDKSPISVLGAIIADPCVEMKYSSDAAQPSIVSDTHRRGKIRERENNIIVNPDSHERDADKSRNSNETCKKDMNVSKELCDDAIESKNTEDFDLIDQDESTKIDDFKVGKKAIKKARKQLALPKEKELRKTVEKEQGCSDISTEINKNKKYCTARRLNGGIVIKDIIFGSGPIVATGRPVSITYEGVLLSGEVFDSHKNKESPFTFRLGTGEVIRGMEKGLAGARVGGLREIVVPAELAYGDKPQPGIPANSTLIFSISVISIGGRRRG